MLNLVRGLGQAGGSLEVSVTDVNPLPSFGFPSSRAEALGSREWLSPSYITTISALLSLRRPIGVTKVLSSHGTGHREQPTMLNLVGKFQLTETVSDY